MPAKKSSSIIPNGPLIFLSAKLTGHGFKMSKMRNRINPSITFIHKGGQKLKVNPIPAASSITIAWLSSPTNLGLAFGMTQMPIKKTQQAKKNRRYSGVPSISIGAQKSKDTIEPMVPGAFLARPLLPTVAMK